MDFFGTKEGERATNTSCPTFLCSSRTTTRTTNQSGENSTHGLGLKYSVVENTRSWNQYKITNLNLIKLKFVN